jgi:lipoprotein-anchoring transpeptidase ErfK/SrfK
MKTILNMIKFRPTKTILAGFVLILMTLFYTSTPLRADEKHNQMAQTIINLMKTNQRWIEIDLSRQRLVAWEGSKLVYAVIVSTGKPSTPTRVGTFKIQTKYVKTRMIGEGYDFAEVPYTMYYDGGMAIHGAYWHNLFGNAVTHGCTNVAVNHAKWLFEWADIGTPVVVHQSEN